MVQYQKQYLQKVAHTVAPYIHRTPVLTSQSINAMLGASVFFKCENFQKMGAFKMRGAVYVLSQLSQKQKEQGVVTHSSGNFAQALSLAAKQLQIPAYIVMPSNAPQVKIDAVKGYGGIITFSEPTLASRENNARNIQEEKKATFIHPSNAINVILGQGTAALELLEDYPELDVLITPVGGGGLIAGTALFAHHFAPNCSVIGGEPLALNDAYRSMQTGKIETNPPEKTTIADGLKTQLGDQNFPIIKQYVDRIICVEEQEIISAMELIWQRLKIVVEPSSAVALAALFHEKDKFYGKQIGVILSGGNVSLANLPF